jgi:hypothetical protein
VVDRDVPVVLLETAVLAAAAPPVLAAPTAGLAPVVVLDVAPATVLETAEVGRVVAVLLLLAADDAAELDEDVGLLPTVVLALAGLANPLVRGAGRAVLVGVAGFAAPVVVRVVAEPGAGLGAGVTRETVGLGAALAGRELAVLVPEAGLVVAGLAAIGLAVAVLAAPTAGFAPDVAAAAVGLGFGAAAAAGFFAAVGDGLAAATGRVEGVALVGAAPTLGCIPAVERAPAGAFVPAEAEAFVPVAFGPVAERAAAVVFGAPAVVLVEEGFFPAGDDFFASLSVFFSLTASEATTAPTTTAPTAAVAATTATAAAIPLIRSSVSSTSSSTFSGTLGETEIGVEGVTLMSGAPSWSELEGTII